MASEQCECDEYQTLTQQVENITLCVDSQKQQSLSGVTNDDQNVNTRNDIEIIRSQPNTSINMAKTFEELKLPKKLLKGLYKMGFSAPTKIQEMALPLLLATPPTNLIVQSDNRTGKTVAFVLASLCRINTQLNYPQVMFVLPTYESVIQTGEVVQRMAKYVPEIKFRFAIRYEYIAQGSRVSEHIIIGTPGKLIDWTLNCNFFDPILVNVFVVNDSDVMIDKHGYRQKIIDIQKTLSPECQMIYLSDTYERNLMDVSEVIIRNPVIIRVKSDKETLDNINQYYVVCRQELCDRIYQSTNIVFPGYFSDNNNYEKQKALFNIFSTISMGQAFLFCQYDLSCKSWANPISFCEQYYGRVFISGNWNNEEQTKRVKRFRDEKKRLLILNNVGAICLRDIGVGYVINYDLPINVQTKQLDKDMYFRRISRTGRFGKKGVVINLVDSVKSVLMVKELENHFGREISILDVTDKSEIEKINQI